MLQFVGILMFNADLHKRASLSFEGSLQPGIDPDSLMCSPRSIMVDIKSGQQRVAIKYLQSESDMLARLEDLRMLRATFAPCPGLPGSAASDSVGARQSLKRSPWTTPTALMY